MLGVGVGGGVWGAVRVDSQRIMKQLLMTLIKPLPPFSGNSCAPPRLLLVNDFSEVPSKSGLDVSTSPQTQALRGLQDFPLGKQ